MSSTVLGLSPLGRLPGAQAQEHVIRVDSLTGKHVVVLENGKQNARALLVGVVEQLQQQHPGLTYEVLRKESASLPADPELLAEITSIADIVLTGSGD